MFLSQLLTDGFDSVVSATERTGGQPPLCLPLFVAVLLKLLLTPRRLHNERELSNILLSDHNQDVI